jgi:hypothetical protein
MPTYTDYPNSINWKFIYSDESLLTNYSKETIKYTLIKLREYKFIESHGGTNKGTNVVTPEFIDDITIKGHNFLTNATNKRVWRMAIGVVHKTGNVSLPVFCELMNKCALIILHEHMRRE